MAANFDSYNESRQPPSTTSSGSTRTIPGDRFELLSAYLDGEVTAAERRQVEEWLATDPTVQQLHARLLKLQQGFQAMPIPTAPRSVEQTVDNVLAKVERHNHLRLVWSGAAIAALFVGTVIATVPFNRGLEPQIAQSPGESLTSPQPDVASEPLLVALDQPLVAIPKTTVAPPAHSLYRPAGESIR